MFPLSFLFITLSICCVIFTIGTLTGYLRRLRLMTVIFPIISIILSVIWFQLEPGYGGGPFILGYFGGAALVLTSTGIMWGWITYALQRKINFRKKIAPALLLLPSLIVLTIGFERQYVVDACVQELEARMYGMTFIVSIEDSALFRWNTGGSGEIAYQYERGISHKDDVAELCRQSEYGKRAIEVDRVDFAPSTTNQRGCKTEQCEKAASAEFSMVATAPPFTLNTFKRLSHGTNGKVLSHGDNADGWICFLPTLPEKPLKCSLWRAYMQSALAISTVEEAHETPHEKLLEKLNSNIDFWINRLQLAKK